MRYPLLLGLALAVSVLAPGHHRPAGGACARTRSPAPPPVVRKSARPGGHPKTVRPVPARAPR